MSGAEKTAARTFMRAVEYWVPGRDRTTLEFGGGLYGTATRFAAISREMVFGRGEGLPGHAWEAGHPVVLKDLQSPLFRRAAAARAAGLTSGIALPIFAGEFLTSVLVIFCSDDEDHAGAIEVWHNDPAAGREMRLHDGYYGSTGDAFELVSRSVGFRCGHGLPGMAWEAGVPVFIDDLGHAQRFLRGDSAVKVGINRGFALPCSTPRAGHWVLAFLSALATPIARRFEVWNPDGTRERLVRSGGFCEQAGLLGAITDTGIERGQGAIGQAFMTGSPALSDAAESEPGAVGAGAVACGVHQLVALPVLQGGRLSAVVAWYF
jgi:hypothetical protein